MHQNDLWVFLKACFVEIDVTELNAQKGRDGVYVVPNDTLLDLTEKGVYL